MKNLSPSRTVSTYFLKTNVKTPVLKLLLKLRWWQQSVQFYVHAYFTEWLKHGLTFPWTSCLLPASFTCNRDGYLCPSVGSLTWRGCSVDGVTQKTQKSKQGVHVNSIQVWWLTFRVLFLKSRSWLLLGNQFCFCFNSALFFKAHYVRFSHI